MPTITYNLDVPFEDNDPSVDQPDMKVNTNAVDQWVAVDHIGFNDNNNLGGHHNVVRLPDQNLSGTVPPSLSNAGTALYALPLSGSLWPVWRNSDSGIDIGTFLFTGNTTASITGSTFITGGIEIKWGQISPVVISASTPYNYPTPFKNNTFRVILHPGVTTGVPATPQQVYVTGLIGIGGKTGFNYLTTPASGTTSVTAISYIAIGN